jgi:putative ATPase
MADVEALQSRPIPKHLRDSRSTTGRKQPGSTEPTAPYLYPHEYPGNYVEQPYMPDGIQSQPYYQPTENGAEKRIKRHLESLKPSPRDTESADPIAAIEESERTS